MTPATIEAVAVIVRRITNDAPNGELTPRGVCQLPR
jgi:hypothetical protein